MNALPNTLKNEKVFKKYNILKGKKHRNVEDARNLITLICIQTIKYTFFARNSSYTITSHHTIAD